MGRVFIKSYEEFCAGVMKKKNPVFACDIIASSMSWFKQSDYKARMKATVAEWEISICLLGVLLLDLMCPSGTVTL